MDTAREPTKQKNKVAIRFRIEHEILMSTVNYRSDHGWTCDIHSEGENTSSLIH